MTSTLSTRVVDAVSGAPAAGLAVALTRIRGAVLDLGATDDDGRIELGPGPLPPGDYTLDYAARPYFARLGLVACYPSVAVSFTIDAGSPGRYHVPLLLGPFAFSTHRG